MIHQKQKYVKNLTCYCFMVSFDCKFFMISKPTKNSLNVDKRTLIKIEFNRLI